MARSIAWKVPTHFLRSTFYPTIHQTLHTYHEQKGEFTVAAVCNASLKCLSFLWILINGWSIGKLTQLSLIWKALCHKTLHILGRILVWNWPLEKLIRKINQRRSFQFGFVLGISNPLNSNPILLSPLVIDINI